jgi:hypothetical protein
MLLRMSRGNFFQFGGQLRQDRDEPLDEGKLLLGQPSMNRTSGAQVKPVSAYDDTVARAVACLVPMKQGRIFAECQGHRWGAETGLARVQVVTAAHVQHGWVREVPVEDERSRSGGERVRWQGRWRTRPRALLCRVRRSHVIQSSTERVLRHAGR